MKNKFTNSFLIVMAVVSIIGFLTIALNSFFGIDIGEFTSPVLLIIFGIAFMIEGQTRFWFKYIKDGRLTSSEFTHLITGIIGIFAVISGFVAFFIKDNPVFLTMQGIIAVIAIIVIVIETFVVK